MIKQLEVRLTMAAYVFGLEEDMRNFISNRILAYNNTKNVFVDDGQFDRAVSRYKKNNKEFQSDPEFAELIEFLDFNDYLQIIMHNKSYLSVEEISQFKEQVTELENIASIRNRVMHLRPLLSTDFPDLYGFVVNTVNNEYGLWSKIIEIRMNIESDPSFPLTLNIPFQKSKEGDIPNNLPQADFDETGFIGRNKEQADVLKYLLLGPRQVVTILGEGGVGKSALLLRVLYEILDLPEEDCPYDYIIWISSKTASLTAGGIKELSSKVQSYASLISEISNEFEESEHISDNLKIIYDYIDNFKILIAIDNLESILDKSVLDFISEASMKCTIAITSRLGIGELERRVNLTGFSKKEAKHLVRTLANMRNNNILLTLSDAQLNSIVEELHSNPLALKWFVNSVDSGLEPAEVLNNKDDLLNFCMLNVYDKLDQDVRKLLDIFQVIKQPLMESELIYLSDENTFWVRKNMLQLKRTSFIRGISLPDDEYFGVEYALTEFTSEFLNANSNIPKNVTTELLDKYHFLTSYKEDLESFDVSEGLDVSLNRISVNSRSELVVSRYLRRALFHSKKGEKSESLRNIENAKSILPKYVEIYRTSGFIKAAFDDFAGAREEFELGMEINENDERLQFFYAGFLANVDDTEKALQITKKLYHKRQNSPDIGMLYAKCLHYRGYYEEAFNTIKIVIDSFSLTRKQKLISINLQLSIIGRWAKKKLREESEVNFAINLIDQGFKIFSSARENNDFDKKIIFHFSNLISIYLYIPDLELFEDATKIEKVIKDNFGYLMHSRLILAIEERFKYCFKKELDVDKSIMIKSFPKEDITAYTDGSIFQFDSSRSYVFILLKNGTRLYCNRTQLIDETDWEKFSSGQKVSFKIREIDKDRPFATNVKLI